MSLPLQSYRLGEVAEAGMDWSGMGKGMKPTGTSPGNAIGECFAFDSKQLGDEASGAGLSWHWWLLRRTLHGLWEERSRNKVYVCYTLHPGVTRVFHCSQQKRHPERFARIVTASPAYIEGGQDSFPPVYARSLAYWEAPCTAVALWPRGLRQETDGARRGYRQCDGLFQLPGIRA